MVATADTEAAALISLYSESSSSELKQTGFVSMAACSSCKIRRARCATHDLEPCSSDVSACLAKQTISCKVNVGLLCFQMSADSAALCSCDCSHDDTSWISSWDVSPDRDSCRFGGRCGTGAAAATSLVAFASLVVSCRQCAGGVGDGCGSVLAAATAGDRLIVLCSCCTSGTRIVSASIFCGTHAAGSSAHGFTTCVG